MRSVLLVHPDAAAWLQGHTFRDEVTPTEGARSARAYLAGTAFDLVLIGPGVEGAEAISALRDVLGLSTVIEHVADASDALARLETSSPPTLARPTTAPPQAPPVGQAAPNAASSLDRLADELGRVAHALNNPLAVIAGNAQLALEMAAALGTNESIVESLQAIRGAASQLEELFAQVAGLRAMVERERGRSRSG